MWQCDVKTIGKHINNALKEELSGLNSVVAKFATTATDNKKYMVEHYNLDVIITVGYRVKSKRVLNLDDGQILSLFSLVLGVSKGSNKLR